MPGHTPRERAKRLPEASPRRGATPILPPQATNQAVDVQTVLGPGFSNTPIIGRSLFGSGKFSEVEMKRGFRVLSRPELKQGQTKVASPGVPLKK